MPPLVIGLIGKKQSGKDSFADTILGLYNGSHLCDSKTAVKYSLAAPIKNVCRYLFCLTDSQLQDGREKEIPDARWGGRSPRQLMQWMGTDVFRKQFDEEFWIRHAHHTIHGWASQHPIVVVPDIRFRNEAAFVRTFTPHLLLRIDRPSVTEKQDRHASETEMDTIPPSWIDAIVVNDASLDQYQKKIRHVYETLILPHMLGHSHGIL